MQKMLRSPQQEAATAFIGPDDIVAALDQIDPVPQTTKGTVQGYKMKVSRQTSSAEEMAARPRDS